MAFDILNFFSGSQSSDIDSFDSVQNPLPLCPDSPNCIRITKKISHPADSVFSAAITVIESMGAAEIETDSDHRKIDTVFRVFLFKDDMTIKVDPGASEHSYLHIRSASRVGESDLGVNRRRVKRFLRKLKKKSNEG